jgi:hypothetical protein
VNVTVRPRKWRETVNEKLGEALQSVYELTEADKPEFNRYSDARRIARECVGAARGVYMVTETLVGLNYKPWPWRNAWEHGLTAPELALWTNMRDVRTQTQHGEGGGLDQYMIQITRGPGASTISVNYVALGLVPPAEGTNPRKGGVRFSAYPDRPASEMASEYVTLCRRFADDFERDHAQLFGAKP